MTNQSRTVQGFNVASSREVALEHAQRLSITAWGLSDEYDGLTPAEILIEEARKIEGYLDEEEDVD